LNVFLECKSYHIDPKDLDFQHITDEQALKLTSLNLHNVVSRKKDSALEKTRQKLVSQMMNIFRRGCPIEFVPASFLTKLGDLLYIYYKSWAARNPKNKFSVDWQGTVNELTICVNQMKRLNIIGAGFKV